MNDSPYTTPKSNLIEDDAPQIDEEPKTYSFKGRIGRIRYIFLTFVTLVSAVFMMLALSRISELLAVLSAVYYLIKIPLVFVFATTQRVHDLGKSGEVGLFALIPFVFLYLYIAPGKKESNEYGNYPEKPPTSEYLKILLSIVGTPILMLIFMPLFEM